MSCLTLLLETTGYRGGCLKCLEYLPTDYRLPSDTIPNYSKTGEMSVVVRLFQSDQIVCCVYTHHSDYHHDVYSAIFMTSCTFGWRMGGGIVSKL